jgi:hypothetical protein
MDSRSARSRTPITRRNTPAGGSCDTPSSRKAILQHAIDSPTIRYFGPFEGRHDLLEPG